MNELVNIENRRDELGRFKKGIVSWMKGKHHTQETKEKIREANKGKKVFITWGAKISKANKGKLRPDMKTKEAREKFRKIAIQKGYGRWMEGKNLSDEHKRKIGEANKGKKHWNYKNGLSHTKEGKKYHQNQRRARKINNGGSHSLQEWIKLKEQYNFTCLKCNKKEPDIVLGADHIIPLFLGGSNNISNIQPLCSSCNSKKGVKVIDYRIR